MKCFLAWKELSSSFTAVEVKIPKNNKNVDMVVEEGRVFSIKCFAKH